jgi:hypothetical protein
MVLIFFVILGCLKKITAILFLGIMLFNGFGYRILSNYFDQKASDHLVSLIEQNNYDESDLISVKTPINLPYYSNSPKFERVDGEMEINGIVYQYVERRVYNDSVEIRVLPNQDRLHIKNAKESFDKLASDFEQKLTEKKSVPVNKSSVKVINFDYIEQDNKWSLEKIITRKMVIGPRFDERLLSVYLQIQAPPPKNIA